VTASWLVTVRAAPQDNCDVPTFYDRDVQLGHFDVSAEVLNAPGQPLERFIGAPGSALIDDLDGPPPVDGWRLISGDLNAPAERQPVFAAPWDNPAGNGWMVIGLWQLDGAWNATILSDSRPVRPSRVRRREGLELDWSHSARHGVGFRAHTRLGQVAVTLQNRSQKQWANRYRDYDGVSISPTRGVFDLPQSMHTTMVSDRRAGCGQDRLTRRRRAPTACVRGRISSAAFKRARVRP
jgi:hypothetical protein